METRWIATTVVLVVSASIIQSPTAAGLLVTQSIDSEDACERQKMNLRCNPGEKIVVQEGGVHYGLLSDSYCYTPSSPLPAACVVDPEVASAVLSGMCSNKESCRFTPDDAMFGANTTACPLFASTNSILRATYNCCTEAGPVTNIIRHSLIYTVVNATTAIVTNTTATENVTIALVQDSKRDSPITATYTRPTAPPKPCALFATKVVNCYLWECRGQWRRMSVDRSDPSCCALWDGCEMSTVLFNATTSTLTISAASCPAVTTVHRNYNITWRRASANMTRTSPCPGDMRAPPSVARRLCKDGGVWDEYINMSLCISPEILNVTSKSVGSGEELEDFSSQLARATDGRQLSTNEIEHVIDELDNIGKGIEQFKPAAIENITQNALHVGENLLETINESKASETDTVSSSEEGMKVVDAIKKMASKVARQATTNITVQSRSTELYVKVVARSNHHKNQDISVKSEKGNSIAFPSRNLIPEHQDSEFGRLVAVFYTNYTRIWSSQDNQTVSSSVFSVAIVDDMAEGGARRSLDAPFQYLLQHQRLPNSGSSSCVFWDSINTSRWSGDGCRQVKTSNTTTTCECDHLTNFAVLLDVTGDVSEGHVALTAITYIGCIISILCLLLAWITFQCLKNLSSDRNTIHKHLVFNLMLAEILFLFAISPLFVQFTVFCQVLAGVLHFLFLCVFAWTCLEGVQLYIMLIEVFEAERSRTMYYYLAGYGIPAIIVGVSAAVDHNGYGRPEVCWLKTNTGFIWSFAGPVAGVMLINTIMLGVAVYMMYKHAKMVANMKHKESSKIDSIRAWLKGAAVLIILLGLTWIFGFGSLDGNKDIQLTMAYIFTVLNSLQGLFIFIFHCVKNEKVQKEYKRYVRRAQWLPTCLRIRYGEHKGLSSVPSHSSNSSGYLSKYFARRRKSSSDLTNSSLRAKKQISGLTSLNTEDSQAEKKELITIHHQCSVSNGNNEQQVSLMAAHQGKPSPV